MNSTFTRFGQPDLFEIAAKWSDDVEARDRLPLTEGWSTGQLRLTVCGQVLTEYCFRGDTHHSLSWYLSPIIDWLLRNWTWLLHEESFAWPDKSGQPAAVATFSALERTITSSDEAGRRAYEVIHAWWSRHALRAADSSAIFPDIYFRRLADDIEISWLSRQPEFAPEGFSLTLAPGYALLPVGAVARPFWQFLQWALDTAPAANDADQAIVVGFVERLASLRDTPIKQLELAYIGEQIQRLLETVRPAVGLQDDGERDDDLPIIEAMDSAVLMFGGLHVDLGQADVQQLLSFLATKQGGVETPLLASVVKNPDSEAWSRPYEEGYRLAEDCRDELGIPSEQLFVDMNEVLAQLGVAIEERVLETSLIRGVAVAGRAYAPAILINKTSFYNNNDVGRRFTLAHELCHILYDRSRARKLSHLSGPWASARIEKRANAFAAMFLAPPSAIRSGLPEITPEAVRKLSADVGIGITALIEHLYNIDLINDAEREALRQQLS